MSLRALSFIALLLAVLGWPAQAVVIETDICVFGATSGGVTTAVQAVRQGKTVALASVNNHVGGMTSGGLGWTDFGNEDAIQGISREFYVRIGARYGISGTKLTFEPKIAESVFHEMLSEAGITPRWNQLLASVTKSGQRITEIAMEDGTIYRAKMFVDATYEGDLLAKAGVSFTVGRESVAQYGESFNGIRASTPSHQFTVNVDPYVVPGNPASGLLPYIQPGNGGTPGDGDHRVQAYNYRMCLTNVSANRLQIPAPPGYDESRYELLRRLIAARQAAGQSISLGSFLKIDPMPNGKTDINNQGAFSTDFIGMNYDYPTASYAERAVMEEEHRNYIQGLFYFLGHGTGVPDSLKTAMLNYGFCKDEFLDTGGFPHQIYVREGRRMVSDYVMLQQNCQGTRIAEDPVGLAAYTMDSHNCQRILVNGFPRNEGDVQQGVSQPFGISYRSIVPKVGECENLLVPWALSASHIAFGSIRMEPVFMGLGQSAASAAVIAIDDNVSVQQVSYPKLALQLVADKHRIKWGNDAGGGIIVDNTDATGVQVSGSWIASSASGGFWGTNYLHDESTNKGTKSVRFTPNLPKAAEYDVYLRWPSHANRSTNIPIDVISATSTQTVTVNQTQNGGIWYPLGRAQFNAGTGGSVLVRTTGTAAGTFVIADAARWVEVGSVTTTAQIITSDAIAREGTADQARFTVVRSSDDLSAPLTVNYQVTGTAQAGADYTTLSGTVTIPAGAQAASISVQALPDSLAEGTETVTIALQTGSGYGIGALGSATARILDRPRDAWRHAHFSASELLDPTISGDTADPESDGYTNLEEYALARDPRAKDEQIVETKWENQQLTLTYRRAKAATDTTVVVEGSQNLPNWGTAGVVQEIARVDEGDTERVTVRLIEAVPAGRGFLRAKITSTP